MCIRDSCSTVGAADVVGEDGAADVVGEDGTAVAVGLTVVVGAATALIQKMISSIGNARWNNRTMIMAWAMG